MHANKLLKYIYLESIVIPASDWLAQSHDREKTGSVAAVELV